jgi:hypothetical protein
MPGCYFSDAIKRGDGNSAFEDHVVIKACVSSGINFEFISRSDNWLPNLAIIERKVSAFAWNCKTSGVSKHGCFIADENI